MLPDAASSLSRNSSFYAPVEMDYVEQTLSKRRESRTRAPTACQTCRNRKTRCDNVRPVCSYCVMQGTQCLYPETSPRPPQTGFDSSSHEILQRLGHITALLEDIRQEGSSGSTVFSNRSLKDSLLDMTLRNASPLTDPLSGSNIHGSSSTGIEEERGSDHDPLLHYTANAPEYMLRWPIFNKVTTESERHVRSFLLDSLDNQPQLDNQSSSVGVIQDDIIRLCQEYLNLNHRRNPILDAEKLMQYAGEVVEQGIGWDGPSCQVLLACALAYCTCQFKPLAGIPDDLDGIPPPPSTVRLELAEKWFNAAKRRLGSLQTSPTDIQCFLLAGSYERHVMRPLQAWFCFQQASCRLEVRLRSFNREQWMANTDYHNLESRLYWACIQAEHETQCELPLWSTGLYSIRYLNPFPRYPKTPSATGSPDNMDDGHSSFSTPETQLSGTEEEKGWMFYIASICNRRTVNAIICDLWRHGEHSWTNNIQHVLGQCAEAQTVVDSWFKMIPIGQPLPDSANEDLEFLLRGRYSMGLERIYRPVVYLAVHYQSMPGFTPGNNPVLLQVFQVAQRAIDNCAELIPNYWYNFRHEWVWNVMRGTFGCALQILAAVLCHLTSARYARDWGLRVPTNWPALIRLSIRTLKYWSRDSIDLDKMRSVLQRMYEGACHLAGISPDLFRL
ncbi:hypothetical protein N7474_003677 [Penicillium riverlandense]|uniref:uncharacterized protein n=1 Tax=Penicillium riverlandense TaxID=1903569 RepID=UPI0025480A7C|nr:uncharacterized protein N7474_003677 [Penicillium riverlandense]KAJ5818086.1 hypothetical protein N7474_003677 [Penicillium riverlandense]